MCVCSVCQLLCCVIVIKMDVSTPFFTVSAALVTCVSKSIRIQSTISKGDMGRFKCRLVGHTFCPLSVYFLKTCVDLCVCLKACLSMCLCMCPYVNTSHCCPNLKGLQINVGYPQDGSNPQIFCHFLCGFDSALKPSTDVALHLFAAMETARLGHLALGGLCAD